MKMKHFFSFLIFLSPFFATAQDSDLGNWLIYIGSKKINEKWNWHNEVQYRNYNAVGDLEQLLLRTGIGYNLTEGNNNILLGYGYIHSQNYFSGTDEKFNVDEHRIFQQFITKQSFGRFRLQHRYRFEQRWIEDSDFRMRFRYFLAANVLLNQKEMTAGAVYLSAYNEIFLNSEKEYFDRNRLYGGVGYKINNAIRVEVGYMNQFLRTSNRDQVNLIAFINF